MITVPQQTQKSPLSKISVVIPFHNAASTIIATLQALEVSSLPPVQVICVDDASTDNTSIKIKAFAVTSSLKITLVPLEQGKRGAAAARNSGSRYVSGNFVLFLDADVVVETNTLLSLISYLEEHRCQAVVGMYRDFSLQAGILAHFQAYLVNAVYAGLDPSDSPCLGTQCVLMKTETFHATTGFDETYRHATVEDFAFGYLLRERGGGLCIATKANIIHNHPYNFATFIKNYYTKARDLTQLLLDNPHINLLDSGYYDTLNSLTILIVCIEITIIVLSIVTKTCVILGICIGLVVPMVWAKFFFRAVHRWGLWKAIRLTGLRILVTLLGGAGCLMAIINSLLDRRSTIAKWCMLLHPRIRESLSLLIKTKNVRKNGNDPF